MHIVMFVIGGIALIAGLGCIAAGVAEKSALKAIYFYCGLSLGLGGVLYLGFGMGLMLLQQLVENTKPLRDLFENAKARMTPEDVS